MDAIVNLFLATSICTVVVHYGVLPTINQTESISLRNTTAVNAICAEIKYQGDFPMSTNRKYAESHEAHYWSW